MREREWDLRKDIGFDRSYVTYVMLKVRIRDIGDF